MSLCVCRYCWNPVWSDRPVFTEICGVDPFQSPWTSDTFDGLLLCHATPTVKYEVLQTN